MKFKIYILSLIALLLNVINIHAQTNLQASTSLYFDCGIDDEIQNMNMAMSVLNTPDYTYSVNPLYLAEFPKKTFNIYFWVIKRTNGTTDYPITKDQILLEMQRINDFFRPAGICFVLQGTGSLNSDQIYPLGNNLWSIVSYAKNNNYYIENSFNVYIHPDQSTGNGATNYGSDCIVMDSWIFQGLWAAPRHSLAHELGHTFDLIHAWGKTTLAAAAHTNEHVIRDPNSPDYNAESAGDMVVDTPAMAQFAKEATFYGLEMEDIVDLVTCEYIGPGKDNLDVPFVITPDDLGNPMQYTIPHCVSGFTTGQAIRMREFIEGSPTAQSVLAMRADNTSITLSVPETNTSFIYQYADHVITNTNYVISSGQNINLKAGDFIFLDPNTDIKAGSVFIAEIEECECESQSSVFNTDRSLAFKSSSIDEIFYSKLYPNPNNGTFDITLAKEIKGSIDVEIYDLSGKVVYKESKQGTNLNINVPNLVSGMYIVRLSSGDYSETIKFVKN